MFVLFVMFYTMALGVGLALKAGLWNIGAQGQFLAGTVMVFVVYLYIGFLPWPVLYVAMILGCRARRPPLDHGPDHTQSEIRGERNRCHDPSERGGDQFRILHAQRADQESRNCPRLPDYDRRFRPGSRSRTSSQAFQSPMLFPQRSRLGIILYFLVERTSFRVKANTVGESAETARYAGISIPRVMTITMLTAGALAGLAGATYMMGYRYELDIGSFSTNYGLLAIIVALVGRKHMLGIGVCRVLLRLHNLRRGVNGGGHQCELRRRIRHGRRHDGWDSCGQLPD